MEAPENNKHYMCIDCIYHAYRHDGESLCLYYRHGIEFYNQICTSFVAAEEQEEFEDE